MRPRTLETDIRRFFAKVEVSPGCWEWQGAVSTSGYGNFGIWPKTASAHRFAYELVRGPVPDGLELDHLCRNRLCVNPAHLEAVTRRENTLRGIAPPALNAVKTECLRGHEFTSENTYVDRHGNRSCIRCRRDAWNRWQAANGAKRRVG